METIYTIGHSNHSIDRLLELLKQYAIEVVADTRSQPYSRYSSQFNRETLKASVVNEGLSYLYMGHELGGRPEGADFYDGDGRVLYGKVAESSLFQEGIARLRAGARIQRVALLCAEEDPAHCHRRLLIGRVLTQGGVELLHIRADGSLEPDQPDPEPSQLSLFGDSTETEWKSIRSVLPEKAPNNSSAF